MTGHVRQRGGRWEMLLELGEQPAQRCPACRKRYWTDEGTHDTCPRCGGQLDELVARRQELLKDRFATKKAAQKALRDALTDREQGTYVPPVDLSTADYLQKRWLPALGSEGLSPNTIGAYTLHVARIVGHIGRIPLQKLGRNDVAVLSSRMASEEGARGKPLSPASRRAVLIVLHRALGDAVKDGLLRSNPTAGVKRPKVRRPEMHTWSQAELSTFLRATRDDRLSPLWRLLAMTGLRRGEALGLKWSDVDLQNGRLEVQRQRVQSGYAVEERQTKRDKPRAVSIDAATVEALREQSQRQLDDAAEWQAAWIDNGHVFTRENGEPWHPDRITKLFDQAVKASGVQRIRLHDLRHTHATLALRAGVHPKVVQERLGHANISITMDTYSHVLPDMQESAAELVAALVDGRA